MKTFQLLIAFFLTVQVLQAQTGGLYWKYKDYDGAIAVSVPRWAMFLGTGFVDKKDDRRLIRKMHQVKVLFFEENSPITKRDIKRFAHKADRHNLEELVTVRTGKTYVSIRAKEHKGVVKRVVVFFNSPDGSGFVSVKGRFQLNDINRVIEKSREKSKKKDGEQIPSLPQIPVIRA